MNNAAHRRALSPHAVLARTWLLAFLSILCLTATEVRALDRFWTGNAANRLWSDPNNWTPVGAPQDGDIVRSQASPSPGVTTNNLFNLRLRHVHFQSQWIVRGNGLTISNGINYSSGISNEFACPVTLGGSAEISLGISDYRLTFSGGLNLNGFNLRFTGPGSVFIPGVISGSGNIANGLWSSGTLSMGRAGIANTFAGTVTVTHGRLLLAGGTPLGAGNALMVDDEGGASLILSNVMVGAALLTLKSPTTLTVDCWGASTWAGNGVHI